METDAQNEIIKEIEEEEWEKDQENISELPLGHMQKIIGKDRRIFVSQSCGQNIKEREQNSTKVFQITFVVQKLSNKKLWQFPKFFGLPKFCGGDNLYFSSSKKNKMRKLSEGGRKMTVSFRKK